MSVHYKINPRYENQVRSLIDRLIASGVPTDANCFHNFRNRLYTLSYNGLNLNIKAFKIPSSLNSIIYTNFIKSKARRSYEHATILLNRGIGTPDPVAYIEIKRNGRLAESYYVSIQSAYNENLRYWEKWDTERRDKVLAAYAVFLARLHDAGVAHHDLSPGNVIWHENTDNDTIDFQLVDLNRMTIYDKPLDEKKRFSNFRNINLVPEETRRLGALYGAQIGMSAEEAAEKAEKALTDDLNKKKKLKKLKKLFKPNR